jgi:hypothetical protein
MAEASSAEAMVARVRPQLEALRQLLDRYDIRAEGKSVFVDIAITEDQIKRLVQMFQSIMGTADGTAR